MRTSMQRAFVTPIGLMLVVAAIIGDAHASDVHGYRTDTIVASNQNECAGVPACTSATAAGVIVPARGRKSERFACPASHPNLWAWDAAQHEHIMVQLVAVDQWTATIEGVNATSVAGQFMVSLGCSTEPYSGSGIQKSRQLAPTAQMLEQRSSSRPPHWGLGQVASDNPCDGVPECQLQPQAPFSMSGWETTTKAYHCKSPYPFAWGMGYSQTGSPSVSAIGGEDGATPGTEGILLTNWNPFQKDEVHITVACSKKNVFGGDCGATQKDPGCPVVAGSQHNYCSSGPVPVCFQTYQERCAPSNQLYSCTIDLLVAWCSPCPG